MPSSHSLGTVRLLSLLAAAAGLGSCGKPSPSVQSTPKVIYGNDDRKGYKEWSETEAQWAESTAALVSASQITRINDEISIIEKVDPFAAKGGRICQDERFAGLSTPGFCSGFLAGDARTFVTAGHCITSYVDCRRTRLVFGLKSPSTTRHSSVLVSNDSIFSCESIKNTKFEGEEREKTTDFAVITLDRPHPTAKPLPVKSDGDYTIASGLTMIGHPSGLPTTVTTGRVVQDSASALQFFADLDAYGGNSGSMVVETGTGAIAGILVNGATDFVWNEERQCVESKKCEFVAGGESDCGGEGVTKSREFLPYLAGDAAYRIQTLPALAHAGEFTVLASSETISSLTVAQKGVYSIGLNSTKSAVAIFKGTELDYAEEALSGSGLLLGELEAGDYVVSMQNSTPTSFLGRFTFQKATFDGLKPVAMPAKEAGYEISVELATGGRAFHWFEVKAAGTWVVGTTGMSDTILQVFAADEAGELSFVGKNDDPESGGLNARVEAKVKPGRYLVASSIFGGGQGSFTLQAAPAASEQ